jgi:hypothetical protein
MKEIQLILFAPTLAAGFISAAVGLALIVTTMIASGFAGHLDLDLVGATTSHHGGRVASGAAVFHSADTSRMRTRQQ